jgi:hypothetical protein
MKLYIVYLYDRHSDPQISVHATRDGADAAIEEFKNSYTEAGLEWVEQNYGRTAGWVRYVDCGDDGPNARIQEAELKQ